MLTEYYFSKLNTNEKGFYDKVKSSLMRGLSGCVLNGCTSEEAVAVMKAVSFDHPEIYNYAGLEIQVLTRGNGVEIPFVYADSNAGQYNSKLNGVIDKLQAALPPGSTDYTVCRKIYEYLAQNVKYDDDAMRAYSGLGGNPQAEQMREMFDRHGKAFTAYGALVDGVAVCFGIARAFKVLCDRLGVECAIAEATESKSGVPHALNVAELDGGRRAFIDVTNGLPMKGFEHVRFDFFAVTQRIVGRQYDVSEEFDCNDETLSWFFRNGLRFTSPYALRKFLEGYSIPAQGNVIRFMLDSKEVGDDWLKRNFPAIINAHCGENLQMESYCVLNGACNGEIKNE